MNKQENTAPPALVIRRVIKAKRDRVFAAWTDPQQMSQWFYCGIGSALVTNTLRVGGSYENKMLLYPDAQHPGCGTSTEPDTYTHFGEYLEIIPPEKIVFTWNSAIVSDSRVTIELRDLGESTELLLTHALLETEDLRQKHSFGWEGCLANLVTYFG